jgi:hypothetical protein
VPLQHTAEQFFFVWSLFHFECVALCFGFAGCFLTGAVANLDIRSVAVTVLIVNTLFSFTADMHLLIGGRAAAAVLCTRTALLFKIRAAGLFAVTG